MKNPTKDKEDHKPIYQRERAVRGGFWEHGTYFMKGIRFPMRQNRQVAVLGFRIARNAL